MHPADVKAALERRNLSLADIARQLGISRNAVRNALYPLRSERVEKAIAEALDLPLWVVFPDRYPPSGDISQSTPRVPPNDETVTFCGREGA